MTVLLDAIGLGLAAGVLHALGVWQSARRWRESALAAAWRLPIVAGVLLAASLGGRLLPAAAGWACGFAAASAVAAVRGAR